MSLWHNSYLLKSRHKLSNISESIYKARILPGQVSSSLLPKCKSVFRKRELFGVNRLNTSFSFQFILLSPQTHPNPRKEGEWPPTVQPKLVCLLWTSSLPFHFLILFVCLSKKFSNILLHFQILFFNTNFLWLCNEPRVRGSYLCPNLLEIVEWGF